MADDSSFLIELNISSSPSTVATNGSENTIMTRSRRAAARERQEEELLCRHEQELMQQQPPPIPPLPALTQRIDNTSATQNLDAAIESANETPAPQATLDLANIMNDDGLNALSLAIRNNNTGGMEVTDEMNKITSISKKYKHTKDKTWSDFLKVVVLHGGQTLATLATTTITNPDGSEINALVQAVQGEQTPAKKNILNYILTIHVRYNRMKQKKLHKKKGDHYEPGTMVNQIKALAQEFNCISTKNMTGTCKYQFFKDFKYPGGCISILQNIWFTEMSKDPLFFGKKPFASRFDPKAYEKVQEAIKTGKLDIDDPHDLLLLGIFAQGFCLWLRGCDEQHTRKWSEYTFGMTANKVEKAMIDLSNDKTYHPWMVGDVVKSRDKLFILETPEDDPFKPVAVLKKLKAIADEQNFEHVLFHQCPTTKGTLTKVTAKDMPILLDELEKRCGWDVKTTGHGLRKGGVTKGAKNASTMAEQKMVSGHARHANTTTTQAIYNQPSEEQKEEFALIRAGHNPPPPPASNDDNANNNFLSQMTFADAKTIHSNNDNFESHSNYFDNEGFPDEITLAQPPPATETILHKKIDDLEKENVDLKNSNSKLTSENTHLICDFQCLQDENQSLKTDIEELNQELSEINTRYEKVDSKLDKRKQELYAAQADIDDLVRRKRKLKKSLENTEEKLKAERKKRKKAEKELEKNRGCNVM